MKALADKRVRMGSANTLWWRSWLWCFWRTLGELRFHFLKFARSELSTSTSNGASTRFTRLSEQSSGV